MPLSETLGEPEFVTDTVPVTEPVAVAVWHSETVGEGEKVALAQPLGESVPVCDLFPLTVVVAVLLELTETVPVMVGETLSVPETEAVREKTEALAVVVAEKIDADAVCEGDAVLV